MPPPAVTVNCFAAIVCPPFWAAMLTCQVPPLPRLPVPSYMPPPLSFSVTTVRMADMPGAAAAQIASSFIHASAFVVQRHHRAHGGHAHSGHRRHEKCCCYFSAGDGLAV